ncbi:ribonuclease III domain-containing protein, partial [Tricharina praecox]|uniref:ribonuclease III domain-containing protein n=1 Tax=Tricharina praecox TaxID=43433 RepID=UPI00221F338D
AAAAVPESLPTLPPSRNPLASAKLPALHARLNLHPNYPLQTLARTLIDSTADSDARFTNAHLNTLGNTLTGYLASEYLMVSYPRLPTEVLYAAVGAYVGNPALASLGREWGVEHAFEPTADVDAGLLQFRRLAPGAKPPTKSYRKKGEKKESPEELEERQRQRGTTLETALANHVRSVFAGVYLHEGFAAARQFFRQHVLSRRLDVDKLFDFSQPTRELSRLCAREGFEPPVARIMSETGRRSRHPVFVVGVFSGTEMMGEGHGGSLDEARIRAAVNALKGWYLYSPLVKDLPSKTEERSDAVFKPAYIDPGEVIV